MDWIVDLVIEGGRVQHWFDGFLFVLDLFVIGIVVRFLLAMSASDWRTPHLDMTIAFGVFLTGETIIRMQRWLLVEWTSLKLVGYALIVVGLLCMVRVMVGQVYGTWTWLVCVLVAATVATLL